jgi:hypothetical protein
LGGVVSGEGLSVVFLRGSKRPVPPNGVEEVGRPTGVVIAPAAAPAPSPAFFAALSLSPGFLAAHDSSLDFMSRLSDLRMGKQ